MAASRYSRRVEAASALNTPPHLHLEAERDSVRRRCLPLPPWGAYPNTRPMKATDQTQAARLKFIKRITSLYTLI